jgi:hypothetical protein
MLYSVYTVCLGCDNGAVFAMTEEQLKRFQDGEHVQDIFPDWSPKDREMLISGTCPKCWEEMWPDEEDEDEYGWNITDLGMAALEREIHGDLMEHEGDQPEYGSDYYVED